MVDVTLVTGAAGCIGSWLVRTLLSTGANVLAADTDFTAGRLERLLPGPDPDELDRIVLDVTDIEDVRDAVADHGVTRIAHLAGMMAPACRQDPASGVAVNVQGAANIFAVAAKARVTRVVYASTAAVYGRSGQFVHDGSSVTESHPRRPTNMYGTTKKCQEDVARMFSSTTGLVTTGLRYSVVYGPGRDVGMTSDITKALYAATGGLPYEIGFSGSTELHYVADVARAFSYCLRAAEDRLDPTYNLHGATIRIDELVGHLNAALPAASRGLISFAGPELTDVDRLDDSAFRQEFPRWSTTRLDHGIAETVTYASEDCEPQREVRRRWPP